MCPGILRESEVKVALGKATLLLSKLTTNFFVGFLKTLKNRISFYSIAREVLLILQKAGRISGKYQIQHESQRYLRLSCSIISNSFYKHKLLLFLSMVIIVQAWNYAKLLKYLDRTAFFLFLSFSLLDYMIESLISFCCFIKIHTGHTYH